MASDKDSFEDRLRRIRESRAQTGPEISIGRGRGPHAQPKSGSMKRWVMGYLVLGLICAGAVTIVAAKISAGPNAMWRETQAKLQDANAVPAEPGLVERLALMVFPSGDEAGDGPIGFLPAAPDGWVRVTTDDAALPNALDAIKARWPVGSNVLPLEQNLGFKHLDRYLDLKRNPGMEEKILSRNGTSAIYLNGNGEFLNVRLDYTSERSALGTTNDPESWIEALAAIEEKALESGEVLERLELGGMEVTNRTNPAGESLIMRPIGSDIYATNGFKIAVALTSRAVLRLEGLTTPIAAQTLMTSIDRDELSALIN